MTAPQDRPSGSQSSNILLSVIIPAFNEGTNLSVVVEETVETLKREGLHEQTELIVVDDGSRDDTGAIAGKLARDYPCLRVIRHEKNRGYGGALQSGIRQSRGAFVSSIPADGEVRIDAILALYREIGEADLVTSTRMAETEAVRHAVRPWHRELLTTGLRLMSRVMLGVDPLGKEGPFLVRGELVRNMPLHSETGLLQLEVIMHCIKAGHSVRSATINFHPRISGVSKVVNARTILRYLWEMVKIRGRR